MAATPASRLMPGPQQVAWLLAAAIAADGALTAHRLWPRASSPPSPIQTMPSPHETSTGKAQIIVSAHLFGEPAGASEPSVAVKSLVLTGTIAMLNPLRGFAMIGVQSDSAHLYAVGEAIATGATLVEVYPERAIIERAGRRESLELQRSPVTSLFASPAPAAEAAVVSAPDSTSADIEDRLRAENAKQTAFTETALMYEGSFRGVRVEPRGDPSTMSHMGLQYGDVLLGVNGILLSPENLGALSAALGSGDKVHLGVLRPSGGGQQLDVVIDTQTMQQVAQN